MYSSQAHGCARTGPLQSAAEAEKSARLRRDGEMINYFEHAILIHPTDLQLKGEELANFDSRARTRESGLKESALVTPRGSA